MSQRKAMRSLPPACQKIKSNLMCTLDQDDFPELSEAERLPQAWIETQKNRSLEPLRIIKTPAAKSKSEPQKIQQKDHIGHRQRLRKRFIQAPEGLLDYELLELLLFGVNPRGDTKPQAKAFLKHFGDLPSLFAAESSALNAMPGLGEAGLVTLKLIPELLRRILSAQARHQPLLHTSEKVVEYCRATMAHLSIEQFRILFMDRKHYLISDEIMHSGTLDRTALYPRETLKKALALHAGGVILIHNHPSGDCTPSSADIQLTQSIQQALKTIEVHLLDHIIVAKYGFFSFREKGLLL